MEAEKSDFYEKQFRRFCDAHVRRFLNRMELADRIASLKEVFLGMATMSDDIEASVLIRELHEEYRRQEQKIANATTRDYGMASVRAYDKICDYLMEVYRLLPRDPRKDLSHTKQLMIDFLIRHWQRYACDIINDEKALSVFRFFLGVYKLSGGETDAVAQRAILSAFHEYTDYHFTPEIAEKWLKMPDVPEELRKIFRIAWIRNGGQELFDRCMKNAEMLKPLEPEKRSKAAMEFHQKFCQDLKVVDDKLRV